MKNTLFLLLFFCLVFNSCAFLGLNQLNSTTYIKAKDSFILGNNEHGKFTCTLKNTSKFELIVWRYPIDGGQHSPLRVQPNQSVKVSVERNTELRIDNESEEDASVDLVVRGDTGLSMGYKK